MNTMQFLYRYRDEYDDKDPAAASAATVTSSEGLVKPAAPATSVYSRPRAPPKIRRPVPLSEQDKYAYKATSTPATGNCAPLTELRRLFVSKQLRLRSFVVGEARRRPADAAEDDYYEDEVEDYRPIRRPLRRRPSYRDRDRDRDRDFYDTRDRDRPFR